MHNFVTIPFADIQAAALPYTEELCRRWLPAGKKTGDWWLAATPWREDKNPSLIVSLTTGKWQDRARGDHGDIFDIYQKLYAVSAREAASDIAQIVGHPWRPE